MEALRRGKHKSKLGRICGLVGGVRKAHISTFFYVYDSKPRLFSGVLAAAMSGFLSFTFLEPLFEPVGLELARVALYLLAINGALVGLSLGVMLPTVFPGLCFGASAALFVGSFGVASMPLYFPVVGGALALIAGTASIRYVSIEQ